MTHQLIPLTDTDDGAQAVMGRDLHAFLEVGQDYTNWIKRMETYGFTAGQDYLAKISEVARQGRGTVKRTDHIMTLDMAKQVAMIQRTDRGRQAREYFLEVEKRYRSASPALSGPELMAAALIEANRTLQQAQARVQELEAPAHSWQQLADATGDWSVSDAAKILSRDDSITIGRDRLFAFMAGLGWVFRTKGRRAHWEAYQRAVDAGRLTHKIGGTFFNERTEETEAAAPTVRITPKGLQDLHRALGGTHQMALFTQPHELSA